MFFLLGLLDIPMCVVRSFPGRLICLRAHAERAESERFHQLQERDDDCRLHLGLAHCGLQRHLRPTEVCCSRGASGAFHVMFDGMSPTCTFLQKRLNSKMSGKKLQIDSSPNSIVSEGTSRFLPQSNHSQGQIHSIDINILRVFL